MRGEHFIDLAVANRVVHHGHPVCDVGILETKDHTVARGIAVSLIAVIRGDDPSNDVVERADLFDARS